MSWFHSWIILFDFEQGCIFRLTCSYPELTEDHVLTSAYVKIFRTVTRNAVNKSVWRKKDCSYLKQTCNEYLIKFSENQSAPKLENRKTSPCSQCAPNLLHVLVSRILGYHNLCSPVPLDAVVSLLRFMILGSGLCVVGSVGGVQCDLGILRLAVGNRSSLRDQI